MPVGRGPATPSQAVAVIYRDVITQRKEEGKGRKLRRRSRSGCRHRRQNYFRRTSTAVIEHSQFLNEYVVV